MTPMQKIISLFKRNYDGDRRVTDEVVPGAEWVLAGEGVATQKLDGTCCMIRDGKLYKRHELKKGRTFPPLFEPAQEPDPVTGDVPGWLPVGDGPEDKWHREAFTASLHPMPREDGTYELIGPKINGNPERWPVSHVLIRHGYFKLLGADAPRTRTWTAIRHWFKENDAEGIVWHHPDGRMVKIKGKDFGLRR